MQTTDAPRLPTTITLTGRHLADGHAGNALSCAIALRLRELTRHIWAVTPTGCYVRIGRMDESGTWMCVAKLTPESEQWRVAYDDDPRSVQPCTLTLELLP